MMLQKPNTVDPKGLSMEELDRILEAKYAPDRALAVASACVLVPLLCGIIGLSIHDFFVYVLRVMQPLW